MGRRREKTLRGTAAAAGRACRGHRPGNRGRAAGRATARAGVGMRAEVRSPAAGGEGLERATSGVELSAIPERNKNALRSLRRRRRSNEHEHEPTQAERDGDGGAAFGLDGREADPALPTMPGNEGATNYPAVREGRRASSSRGSFAAAPVRDPRLRHGPGCCLNRGSLPSGFIRSVRDRQADRPGAYG